MAYKELSKLKHCDFRNKTIEKLWNGKYDTKLKVEIQPAQKVKIKCNGEFHTWIDQNGNEWCDRCQSDSIMRIKASKGNVLDKYEN